MDTANLSLEFCALSVLFLCLVCTPHYGQMTRCPGRECLATLIIQKLIISLPEKRSMKRKNDGIRSKDQYRQEMLEAILSQSENFRTNLEKRNLINSSGSGSSKSDGEISSEPVAVLFLHICRNLSIRHVRKDHFCGNISGWSFGADGDNTDIK